MGRPDYLSTSLESGKKGGGRQGAVWGGYRRLLGEQSACIQPVRTRKKVLGKFPLQGVEYFPPPFTVKLEQSWENGTGVTNQDTGLFTQLSRGALRKRES